MNVGELIVFSTKWPALRFGRADKSGNFPFSGDPLVLEKGSPVPVVDNNPLAYGMLRNYCLCLTAHGYVWIWFTSQRTETDR